MSTKFTQFTARFTGTKGHILTQEAAELSAAAFAREERAWRQIFEISFLSAREKKKGAAAFASEEARRQIFERAWNAGRNAAVFAQDAVSSEEVGRQYIQTYTHTHTHTHTHTCLYVY